MVSTAFFMRNNGEETTTTLMGEEPHLGEENFTGELQEPKRTSPSRLPSWPWPRGSEATEPGIVQEPYDDILPDLSTRSSESSVLVEFSSCEVIDVVADSVICWVQLSPGLRVKTSFEQSLFGELSPHPGLEFLWSVEDNKVLPMAEEDDGLAQVIERLNREWEEDLKHRELHDSDIE
jgi:hypothetical protein